MFPDDIQKAITEYLRKKNVLKKAFRSYPPMMSALLALSSQDKSNLFKVYQCTLGDSAFSRPTERQTSYPVLQAILKSVSQENTQNVDKVLNHLYYYDCLDEKLFELVRGNRVFTGSYIDYVMLICHHSKHETIAQRKEIASPIVNIVCKLHEMKLLENAEAANSNIEILLYMENYSEDGDFTLKDVVTELEKIRKLISNETLYQHCFYLLSNCVSSNQLKQSATILGQLNEMSLLEDTVAIKNIEAINKRFAVDRKTEIAKIHRNTAAINDKREVINILDLLKALQLANIPKECLQACFDVVIDHDTPTNAISLLSQLNEMVLLEDHAVAVKNIEAINKHNTEGMIGVLGELQKANIPKECLQACFDTVIEHVNPRKAVYVLCQLNEMGLLKDKEVALQNIKAINKYPSLHVPYRDIDYTRDFNTWFSTSPDHYSQMIPGSGHTSSLLIYLLSKLNAANIDVYYLQMIYDIAIKHCNVLRDSSCTALLSLLKNGHLANKKLARFVFPLLLSDHGIDNMRELDRNLNNLKAKGVMGIVEEYAKRATNPRYIDDSWQSLCILANNYLLGNEEIVKLVMEYVVGENEYAPTHHSRSTKSVDVCTVLGRLHKTGLLENAEFFQAVIAYLRTHFDPIKSSVRVGANTTRVKLRLSVKPVQNPDVLACALVALNTAGLFNPSSADATMIFYLVVRCFANLPAAESNIYLGAEEFKFKFVANFPYSSYIKKIEDRCRRKSDLMVRMFSSKNWLMQLPDDAASLIVAYSENESIILGRLLLRLECDMEKTSKAASTYSDLIDDERRKFGVKIGLNDSAMIDISDILEQEKSRAIDATILGIKHRIIKILMTPLESASPLQPDVVLKALRKVMALIISHANGADIPQRLDPLLDLQEKFQNDVFQYIKAFEHSKAATVIQAGGRVMCVRNAVAKKVQAATVIQARWQKMKAISLPCESSSSLETLAGQSV